MILHNKNSLTKNIPWYGIHLIFPGKIQGTHQGDESTDSFPS
jgi:hypothetical protein